MAPHLTSVSKQLPQNDRIARRRLMKQMVERRRRERIDLCLDNIKTLVLTNLNKNPADYEKMEKADILEMTVHYLARQVKGQKPHSARQLVYPDSQIQTQQFKLHEQATRHTSSYRNGHHTCIQETRHFMNNTSASAPLKSRLLKHLKNGQNCAATASQACTTNKKLDIVKKDVSPLSLKSYWRPW